MDPSKALEASAIYGINNVMLILISFFLAGLIIYILKQSDRREIKQLELNEKRELRLAEIINKDIKQTTTLLEEHDKKTSAAIAMITEAQKYVRIEHQSMMQGQQEQTKILSHLSDKLDVMQDRYEQLVKR